MGQLIECLEFHWYVKKRDLQICCILGAVGHISTSNHWIVLIGPFRFVAASGVPNWR